MRLQRIVFPVILLVILLMSACGTAAVVGTGVEQPVDEKPGLLTVEQVVFDAQGLAETVRGEVRAEIPVLDAPAFGGAAPEHLRFLLGKAVTEQFVSPNEPQLLIYPVKEYTRLFEEAGTSLVADQIGSLQELLATRSGEINGAIPTLPLMAATQDLTVQVHYLDFAGGSGIRFVGRYSQSAEPFTNDTIFYTFQGLTSDGKYYIALYYPVSTSILPGTFSDTEIAKDPEAFMEGYEGYRDETAEALDNLDASDFSPDLTKLDALVGSLHIGN